MSKHEIPDAAVEAALAVYLTKCNYNAEEIMRLVIEAAAPLMHCDAKTVTERDEMAEVIWGVEAEDFGGYKTSVTSKAADQIAAALLAAGYRKVAE